MSTPEIETQPQRQSFSKAEINTITIFEDAVKTEIPILRAELETGDRIIIPGDQPGHYNHPPIGGQTVLATVELVSNPSRKDGHTERLHLVKVTDHNNEDYQQTITSRAHSSNFRIGDFFLASEKVNDKKVSFIDGIAFIPNSTLNGVVGSESNLEWMNYPGAHADPKSPIRSIHHRLIFSNIDGDIAIMPLGYESAAERAIPTLVDKSRVTITTVASPEHMNLVESQIAEPQRTPIRKKAAARLLRIVRI